jgi:hypothetical protein
MLRRLLLLAALTNCSSGLPLPESTTHSPSAYQPIPYPPPAGLAETIPARPRHEDVVWMDGEWIYQNSGFVWRRGGWVVPPPQGRFASSQTHYLADGRLLLACGTWYDEAQHPLNFIEPIVPAFTPLNDVTSEVDVSR